MLFFSKNLRLFPTHCAPRATHNTLRSAHHALRTTLHALRSRTRVVYPPHRATSTGERSNLGYGSILTLFPSGPENTRLVVDFRGRLRRIETQVLSPRRVHKERPTQRRLAPDPARNARSVKLELQQPHSVSTDASQKQGYARV